MSRGKSSSFTWMSIIGLAALAASVMVSDRLRSRISSYVERMLAAAGDFLSGFQVNVRTPFERGEVNTEEIARTTDTATTQSAGAMTVSKVMAALEEEPRLRGQNFSVRIIGGILHLEGEVRGEREKALVADIARRVSGARLVANDLQVTSPIG